MLDKDSIEAALKIGVSAAVVDTLVAAKAQLNDELKGANGGLQDALQHIKVRAESFIQEHPDGADYSGAIQVVVAEELASAISGKVVQVFTEKWLPDLSAAIASSVAKAIDDHVRSLEVTIPAGQAVNVPQGGQSAGNGVTTNFSPTGQLH